MRKLLYFFTILLLSLSLYAEEADKVQSPQEDSTTSDKKVETIKGDTPITHQEKKAEKSITTTDSKATTNNVSQTDNDKKAEAEKKNKAKVANTKGKDLPISTKQAVAICSFIRGKNPQKALALLEQVIAKKIAIPMKGEVPHRNNMPKGKVAGRYPVKASKEFIKLLKNLIANASSKGMDIDKITINKAIANKASRPFRGTRIGFGRKYFKRTHVALEVAETARAETKEASEKGEGR